MCDEPQMLVEGGRLLGVQEGVCVVTVCVCVCVRVCVCLRKAVPKKNFNTKFSSRTFKIFSNLHLSASFSTLSTFLLTVTFRPRVKNFFELSLTSTHTLIDTHSTELCVCMCVFVCMCECL